MDRRRHVCHHGAVEAVSQARRDEPLCDCGVAMIADGPRAAVVSAWRSPGDVFAGLKGEWKLLRRLDGRGWMQGTATFSDGADGNLAYHERGRVRLDAQEFEAERKYVFAARPAGFAVYFAETPLRLFHEVELTLANGTLSGQATHLCAADLYRSRYVFLPDGRFTIDHEVTGPKKSYLLSTMFAR